MPPENSFSSTAEGINPLFCCPYCRRTDSWSWTDIPEDTGRLFRCRGCSRTYSHEEGIYDFVGLNEQNEVITPFQRLMQYGPITAIYEKAWRPTGFFIASSSSFRQFANRLLGWVSPQSRSSILDLACGPGLFTLPLVQKTSGQIVGVDLSRPMLQRARQLLCTQGSSTLLVRASAFHLPFPDRTFDAILCSGALHLFDRPEDALREISRTLQPGGDFICQTTIKPRHSAGLATFLDKIIRFGFFPSTAAVDALVESLSLKVELRWHQRIIYLFRARKL